MKNQLRKATLRAAALTMSATIAATSVPMTAFAQDTNEGNDGEQKKQESQKEADAEEKAVINQEANDTAPAVQAADDVVKEIVPAKEIKDDKTSVIDEKTGESKTVETVVDDAKAATGEAVSKEGEVKKEISGIDTLASDISSKENTLTTDVENAEESIFNENSKIDSYKNQIDDLKKKADSATYKEDAQDAINKAHTIAEDANKEYETAKDNYDKTVEALNDALDKLNEQKKKYDTALKNSVTKLDDEEKKIAAAEKDVEALEKQVAAANKELEDKGYNLLKDEFFKKEKSDDDKKKLVKDILNTYYLRNKVSSSAKDAEVVNYVDGVGYEVSYKEGDKEKTIYISIEDNGEKGVEITHKESEYIAAHYSKEDLELFEEKQREGTALEQNDELYVFNKNFDTNYTAGVVEDKETNTKVETKIENISGLTLSDDGKKVEVKGNVTTITTTSKSLNDVTSTTTYTTREAAEQAAEEFVKTLFEEGYEYQYKLAAVPDEQTTTTWNATATYVEKFNTTKTQDVVSHFIDPYSEGDTIVVDSKKGRIIRAKDEYVENSFWDKYYNWSIDYIDNNIQLKTKKVNYCGIFTIFNEETKAEIIARENKELAEKGKGGCAVYIDWLDLDVGKGTLYYVEQGNKTVSVDSIYTSEDAAMTAVREKLQTEKISVANAAGVTATKKETKTTTYTYKITNIVGTKKVTEELGEKVISSSDATKLNKIEATTVYNQVGEKYNLANDEEFKNDQASETAYNALNSKLSDAKTALGKAEDEVKSLKSNIKTLQASSLLVDTEISDLKNKIDGFRFDPNNSNAGMNNSIKDIDNNKDTYNNKPSKSSNNNNNNSSSNNNNNSNNQPGLPTLPAGPIATTNTTNTTPTQQVVTLVDDQTPLSATADDTVAPKTNKKAAKKNAAKTTDSDSKKTNKNNTKKQPKKVTPEVEDDTIDEDLEIVSLDDNDQVPLAPGVASNDSTKDIMDETASVSWLWLIILAVASVVTFGTYKGVKKHNENKGKNNR